MLTLYFFRDIHRTEDSRLKASGWGLDDTAPDIAGPDHQTKTLFRDSGYRPDSPQAYILDLWPSQGEEEHIIDSTTAWSTER